MKIIEQSSENIDRNIDTAKLIEVCGRTCYKSEDKITDTSADVFVKGIAKRKHFSVLEHGTLVLKMPWPVFLDFKLFDHEAVKFLNMTGERQPSGRNIISGNLMAWFNCMKAMDTWDDNDHRMPHWYIAIMFKLWKCCQPAFEAFFGYSAKYRSYDSIVAGIFVVEESDMTASEKFLHAFRTVRFITNRGATHELVRHRPTSPSQESTRYVGYGGAEMQFIKPVWWNDKNLKLIPDEELTHRTFTEDELSTPEFHFLKGLSDTEFTYNQLLNDGWRPEQAREELPNALKTEIVVTANLKEWAHIFKMRTAKAAHPQIRALMIDCQKKMEV